MTSVPNVHTSVLARKQEVNAQPGGQIFQSAIERWSSSLRWLSSSGQGHLVGQEMY